MVLSMEEDGRTHIFRSAEVCEESRGSGSSSSTVIAEEPVANTHDKTARNPNMEWLISIMGEDDPQDKPEAGSKPRIQKVPARIREKENNKNYFDPRVVSLGPYHHGKRPLDQMEKHKIMAAKRFVLRNQTMVKPAVRTQAIERFYKKVMDVIGVAKECYAAETVAKLSDEAFARMMFLDGCFILYFIQGMNDGNINLQFSNDVILLIVRDMFLVENQLPFEVLDALMSLRFESIEEGKKEMLEFINRKVLVCMGMFYRGHSSPKTLNWRRDGKPLHLLDVLRTILLDFPPSSKSLSKSLNGRRSVQLPHLLNLLRYIFPPSEPAEMQSCTPHNFGSVMELKEAGIRLGKNYKGCMMGIRFQENLLFPRLLLPTMFINDATISQLLNLTAFEVCSDTHSGCGVTSYICFLDSLINDGADVKELRSKGLLHHALGSDEDVARLFNEWPTEAMNDLNMYIHVKRRILFHLHSGMKISIARWLDTHSRSPWTAISFLAAVLLLFFTCIQTVFTVFPRRDTASTHV